LGFNAGRPAPAGLQPHGGASFIGDLRASVVSSGVVPAFGL